MDIGIGIGMTQLELNACMLAPTPGLTCQAPTVGEEKVKKNPNVKCQLQSIYRK